jgi:hypothetical protein
MGFLGQSSRFEVTVLIKLVTMFESKNERPVETLIHRLIDSQCIRDLQDKTVEIAPAEGKRPLGIFKDKVSKEMNFPTLFYGDPHPSDITK